MRVNRTLSVVMATYDDFDGVYMTVQTLLSFHMEHIDEIIVLDNNPTSKHGELTKNEIANIGNSKVKYLTYTEINGTAATRDLAIRSATSDVVMCIDPHVIMQRDSVAHVRDYFEQNPDSGDLIQGPLLLDNHVQIHTHFNFNVWRGEMWGIWDTDEKGNGEVPFEIEGNGLGMFAVLREKWLGFNPNFRGFGGEEGYIHTKYRQAGRKTICIPQALWVHRFGRVNGVPYALSVIDKARNYVIGFKELGLPLTPIREHFVTGGAINPLDWKDIEKGEYPKPRSCQSCVGEAFDTIDEWNQYARLVKGDINEHSDTLREMAQGRIVVDFGHRTGTSSVALASSAKEYTMLHPVQPTDYTHIAKFLGAKGVPCNLQIADTEFPAITPCQVLFLDMTHTYDFVKGFLAANGKYVTDYIVIHDTDIYGEQDPEGKKPGMMQAVREFLRENTQWRVQRHYQNQYGLTVLSALPEDRPEKPGILRQASNFTKALARHTASGARKVSMPVYETRLAECDLCESRTGDQCSVCGCFIEIKASWETSACPLAKW